MKSRLTTDRIHVAVVEGDLIRFFGFRALLESQDDLELSQVPLSEIQDVQNVDVALLTIHSGPKFLQSLKWIQPGLRFIVTGRHIDDKEALTAISCGAKGVVDESSSASNIARAIRTVHGGSVWAPRRVLATLVEKASATGKWPASTSDKQITAREKEVLELLVVGRSNKEIASPLGIEERTVKAHVSHLLRKLGVSNRIMLSMQAVNHGLVSSN